MTARVRRGDAAARLGGSRGAGGLAWKIVAAAGAELERTEQRKGLQSLLDEMNVRAR